MPNLAQILQRLSHLLATRGSSISDVPLPPASITLGPNTDQRLIIVFYNPSWVPIPTPAPDCPTSCELIFDKGRLEEANAVIFHIPTLQGPITINKHPRQAWVALSMESDINYPMLADPTFMKQFDLTMTYRRDSDIWSPYLGPRVLEKIFSPPQIKTEEALAVYFASNHADMSGRAGYVRELMNYIQIDSYGRSLRNKTLEYDEGRTTKLKTIARYKFTLAFENSISKDYVTEKFFDALIAGSVPVYLGAPNINDFAPADKCFVNVTDFEGPRELAVYLQHLGENNSLYEEYLAWKQQELSKQFAAMLEYQQIHPSCRLCMKLQHMM